MIENLESLLNLGFEKFCEALPSNGSVLDLGCGKGRFSLPLSQKGFQVTALDRKPGIRESENITVVQEDIRAFSFDSSYDGMVCTFVLHFLSRSEMEQLLKTMQEKTNSGGVHLLCVFTPEGELGSSKANFICVDELKSHYQEWELLFFKEHWVNCMEKHSDGTPKRHLAAAIVARKP